MISFVKHILVFTLSFIIFGCNTEEYKVSKEDLLLQAFFNDYHDMYPEKVFDYFATHKIKSISFVSKNLKDGKVDSLTYLFFDESGKLIRRTTKECTTIGCLPYMNRQEYKYNGNKIVKIKIYTFKKNKQPTLTKWLTTNITQLVEFDCEDYVYRDDSIFVESAIAKWEFSKNSKGDIITRLVKVKSTNQSVKNEFSYTDTTIISKLTNNYSDAEYLYEYKYQKDKIDLWVTKIKTKELKQSYKFNPSGLLIEKTKFENGKVITRTDINYSYY